MSAQLSQKLDVERAGELLEKMVELSLSRLLDLCQTARKFVRRASG